MSDEDDGILIKLYEPLPTNFQVKDQLWITKEVVTSHTETILKNQKEYRPVQT